jgi:hypothetical protein
MTDNTHNRSAKQFTIFDEFVTAGPDVSNTLTITTWEDLRGDGCSYTTDPTVINNVLADFSGDLSIKMKVLKDPTAGGLVLTLTDSSEQPVTSAPQVHTNRIGHTERDAETGLLWYNRRGEFVLNKEEGI